MKLKPGTVVKIYKGTPHFEGGAVSRVLDYDPHTEEYLVGENVGEDDHWVKKSEIEEVIFERRREVDHFSLYVLTLTLGIMLGLGADFIF